MAPSLTYNIARIAQGRRKHCLRRVVAEQLLRVRINGRDLATLVCSPHQLNFLLAGFLRLQGLADSLDEIQALGICAEAGVAEVWLKNSLPAQWLPTLTSGCGGGIVYNLPQQLLLESQPTPWRFRYDSLLLLLGQLAKRAELYREHGGIHSAAVGDEDGLLLFAEDLGRHNTLDRLAGEAWFQQLDLRGRMLVTSGRVSSEMVVKAARLGIGLIASRSSPTDRAIELCEQAGITLIGYLRGESMEIFSHPQQLQIASDNKRLTGITGVILAGGESQRMGSDKALLPIHGARFIDHVYNRLAGLFHEMLIVTNAPELFPEFPCRKVKDIYPAGGALAGIHAGLKHAGNERIFVIGCDMPFVAPELVRTICARAEQADLILPVSSGGHEPLHALYSKACLPAMEHVLAAGERRIASFFDQVRVAEISTDELQQIDPQERSFRNINTPEEYFQLRGKQGTERISSARAAAPQGCRE